MEIGYLCVQGSAIICRKYSHFCPLCDTFFVSSLIGELLGKIGLYLSSVIPKFVLLCY